MKKSILIIILFAGVIQYQYAQKLSDIIPPSPTAASIAQFADVPVSNYTGLPNIDIPIYNIKSGPLTVPISLQYHGGGIKIAQEASWVGLGWALNCGGSISRMIKGNDDLDTHLRYSDNGGAWVGSVEIPYINSYNIPQEGTSSIAALNQYYQNLVYDGHDPEPDIFFYNFGSYSGKFVIDKSASSLNEIVGRPLDIDAQAVKICYFIDKRLWIITDPTGIEYRFSVAETTTTYSYSNSASLANILENRNAPVYNQGSGTPLVTSWYINEISSPFSKDKITFEYETQLHNTKSQIRVGEIVPRPLERYITCVGYGCSGSADPVAIYSGSVDVTQDVYLKKINYSNGYVLFDTDNRIDLIPQNGTIYKPQRLYSIRVYNNSNTLPTVTAYINCDYFKRSDSDNSSAEYHRLKLNSLYINDQKYQFEYNEPSSNYLPSKITLSIDDWGYFNNANNKALSRWTETGSPNSGTLIPGITYKYLGQTVYMTGADRDAHEEYTKYFVLKKISLPTGGSQIFNWEPNEYFSTKVEKKFSNRSLPYGVATTTTSGWGSTMLTYTGPEFDITDNSVYLNLNLLITKDVPFVLPKGQEEHPYFGYYKLENGIWNKYQLTIGLYFDVYGNSNPQFSLNFNNTILTKGKYKFFMSHLNTIKAYLTYYYTETPITLNTGVQGNGLRIKSIEFNDGYKTTIKKYQYLNRDLSVTSGIQMENPVHHLQYRIENGTYCRSSSSPDLDFCIVSGDNIIGDSRNILPLSGRGDNFIGYSCVRSSYEGDTNLGETIYEYFNSKPTTIVSNPPPNFPAESDPRNGKPFRITINNNKGKTVQETSYTYKTDYNYRKNTPGTFIYNNIFTNILPSSINEYRPLPFSMSFYRYNNYTDWIYLQSETNVIYDLNGNNPVTTIKQYSYENDIHNQPTKIVTTDNQGNQSLETRMAYPLDLPNEPFASNLIVQNRKSIPLRIETFRGTKKLSEQITKYSTFPSSISGVVMTLPEFVWAKKGAVAASQSDNKVTYNYDDSGNIIEYTPESGATTVLIWGYKKTQPIAKIENVKYTSIPAATITNLQSLTDVANATDLTQELLIINSLNALRTSFPNAMITTYTHKPNIGVSTITDPKGDKITHTYDVYGRLQNVKDKDGNILNENQYYYKN
jgi:hypothetical protein